MCGICGIIEREGSGAAPEAVLGMCGALTHRGPDDRGLYLSPSRRACLGHTRLSIIDLSAAGQEPLSNEDGTLWLTFNGEIYNFRDLRARLEGKGHVFRSRTDAEVLLHLYEEVGEELTGEIRGMFAFALWDEPRQRLFFARDRIGKKPFHYRFDRGAFTFASELTALMKAVRPTPEIDRHALDLYLSYQFIPSPLTIYKGVRKLEPGHRGTLAGGELRIERYWDVPPPSDEGLDEEEHAARVRAALTRAVAARLVSDVPLGAFLSGGLDSSIIAAVMQSAGAGPVRTFAIGFADASYDERPFARRVADFLGTRHEEYVVEYDIRDLLPRLVAHFGEPFGDSSAVPVYYLSRMTRSGVTVALSGDGGDELFGGYRRYLGRKLVRAYHRVPRPLRRGVIEPAVLGLPEGTGYYGKSLLKRAKLFISQSRAVEADPLSVLLPAFDAGEARRLTGRAAAGGIDPVRAHAARYTGLDGLSRMIWTDLHAYLPDDIMVKVDRMSMAHSLEVRCPFLDEEVIAAAAAVPASLKLRRLTGKHILRKAFAGRLPPEIFARRKQGFQVPLASWFKGELKGFSEELVLGAEHGLFDKAVAGTLLREHQAGTADHSRKIWLLMVFNLWHLSRGA